MSHSTKRPRTPEELWEELLKRRKITDSGCWEYTGQKNYMGYGKIKWMGITTGVHRAAAAIKMGFPLKGREIQICHNCDNPACFNPDHLYDGTTSTNQLDSILRGTHFYSRKTHCPNGHPYDEDNTVIERRGREYSASAESRKCRTCKLERQRKWWAEHGKEWRKARKDKAG